MLWQNVKHFWRAWPFIAIAFLGAVHWLALMAFPANKGLTHNLASTAMQLGVVLILLYSLNANLLLFLRKTLPSIVADWFDGFQFKKRNITLSANGVASTSSFGSLTVSVGRTAMTLEERITEIEKQVKENKEAMLAKEAALNSRIEVVSAEMSQQAVKSQAAINELSNKLQETAVGGFKLQLFGALLAVYVAGIAVFTYTPPP